MLASSSSMYFWCSSSKRRLSSSNCFRFSANSRCCCSRARFICSLRRLSYMGLCLCGGECKERDQFSTIWKVDTKQTTIWWCESGVVSHVNTRLLAVRSLPNSAQWVCEWVRLHCVHNGTVQISNPASASNQTINMHPHRVSQMPHAHVAGPRACKSEL